MKRNWVEIPSGWQISWVERRQKAQLKMRGEAASGFKSTEVTSSRGLGEPSGFQLKVWEKKYAKVLSWMKAWCDSLAALDGGRNRFVGGNICGTPRKLKPVQSFRAASESIAAEVCKQ